MSARRGAILREMGLAPIWRLRGTAEAGGEEVEPAAGDGVQPAAEPSPAVTRQAPTAGGPALITEFLEPSLAQGRGTGAAISTPGARPAVSPGAATRQQAHAVVDAGRVGRIATLDWEALEADMRDCRACRLCERRKQAVPGVGDREAEWMLVGEGPGAEEDQRGEPFVGAAGKLLDAMLASIGLKRGEGVYIANAVKCRPPHNRTPQPDEIAMCKPYLERQIALVRPRIVVALGRPAAMTLLDAELSISASRGRVFDRSGTPVVVTYHPAYLLRNQADKAKAWEDLCFARKVAGAG